MYSIDEIKKNVEPIAKEYGINSLALFGSYARGEATEKSDMDFLILDIGKLKGYFKLAGLKLKLEDTFNTSVDLLTVNSVLNKEILDLIKKDEVIIYDA